MLDDKCMFFLGAGASVGPAPSLPTARQLSEEMAQDCDLKWYEYIPLSTISFYYEDRFTREELNAFLKRRIQPELEDAAKKIPPSPTVSKLMELIKVLESREQTTYTITTNYDQQFETAYKAAFERDAEVIIYKGAQDPSDKKAELNWTAQGPLGEQQARYWRPRTGYNRGHTVLYKMHGCISQPEKKGLVVTEEDYINFLANSLWERNPEKTLLSYIMGELAQRTVVFIGYSLSDWNFRAIFKATAEKWDNRDSRSYAIQYRDPNRPQSELDRVNSESVTTFWHEKRVDILNVDGRQFLDDLNETLAIESGSRPAAEAQHA